VYAVAAEFSRLLTLLRKEKGISQKSAAQQLGVSQALLSHYENGIRECGLDFLVRAADFYGVSCDYILGRTPDRNGLTLTIEELPESDAAGKENSFRNGVQCTLNKKLITNSLNIIFDLLNRSGSRLTDAEYYSGCAASYTNLNWRINTLPKYYWSEAGEDISAYDNWGSEDKDAMRASYQAFYDEVEKRFGEVMSAALGTLYPDVKMISGIDVIYTVQMMLYTQHIGSGTGKVTHAFEFKLVDTGKFEYVRMYALSPEYELMKDANFE